LVDVMTHHGFVMPISRHGLNRLIEHGVLAKITFEETLEMLFEAAALGHFDPLLGVSENIMVGRQPSLGTNLPKMYMQKDNGVRVPCVRGAHHTGGGIGNDTRVVCSVVTEDDSTALEQDTAALTLDDALDRALFARQGGVASPFAASGVQTVAADADLYQHQLFRPSKLNCTALAPFRPSSPGLGIEEDEDSFKPSSPLL